MLGYLASTFGASIDSPNASTAPEIPMSDLSGTFVQVILTLAVIIGLIVLLIRFLAAKNKRWSGDRNLRIHGGLALGQHKSLQVVEIGNAVYIVGVGENITLLDKIDDPAKAEALITSLEAKSGVTAGAAVTTVAQLFARFRKPTESDVEQESSLQSQDAFRDLLNQKLQGVGKRKDALDHWRNEDPMHRRHEDS